jgi:hypothetical protein
MSDSSVFKQIVGYVDQLNRDVGQLAIFAEAAMDERGWASLPSAGSRVCWYMSHALDKAHGWRLPDLCRFYTQADQETVDRSVFCFISLDVKTAFDFPTILCGRAEHERLTEHEIFIQVFQTARLRPLLRQRSPWRLSLQNSGWARAEPGFRSSVDHLQVYILNLFDIGTKQRVIDNIVRPLTEDAALSDLRSVLTVENYLPSQLAESTEGIGPQV